MQVLWAILDINTLGPRKNGRHFADSNSSSSMKIFVLIQVSYKCVPEGPIHNISAVVQMMVWHRIAEGIVYPRIYASLGPNQSNELDHVYNYATDT